MANTIEDLIPEYIRGLPAYIPGRPIEEVERELKIYAIKLASNENPIGPSPKAVEAVKHAVADANRYPDGGTHLLRAKLARQHGVTMDQIFVGLGSSEIIDLTARILLSRGKTGVTSHGSYAPFSLAIRASGADLVRVPQQDFAFDLRAIADAVLANRETRLVYLANPNNPTGTAFGAAEFQEFLRRVPADVLVVLDEAYIHYADRPDMPDSVELFREHKNLLTLRTFSKAYGLAGLRVGYGIGDTPILEAMNKLRTPFNLTGVSQAAAIAALDDDEHVNRSIRENAAERTRLTRGLTELGLRPVRSHANFIFIDIGPDAQELYNELLHEGVIVRPLGWMGMPEAMRVSVGIAEENDKLLAVMSRVLAKREGKSELTTR
ncbi:MAG: Histidinol-phosphate aminotransferase [Candidatus Acidoferrum typicum]|nr:Histidinol-phosphate aminotransferase [Candidatus Acidoferrum typicum]